jgi:hypothetical protein
MKLDKTNRIGIGIISFTLGLIGLVDSVAIAFFVATTLSSIIPSFNQTYENYIIIATTSTIVAMLVYGSYLILAKNIKKGGKMNMAGGCLQICFYIYYSTLSQPNLLGWLNPIGIALLLPSILGGLIVQLQPNRSKTNKTGHLRHD